MNSQQGTVYFDLETDGVGPGARITCGVVTGDTTRTDYHSGAGTYLTAEHGTLMVDELAAAGHVVGFNSASFDFRMLFELTGDERCKALAVDHTDVMLAFAADKGYYSSMQSFAEATLGEGGGKTNTGAWAATAWFGGEAAKVMQYCVDDTMVLKKLHRHVLKWGMLKRKTKAGHIREWAVPTDTMLTAGAAVEAWKASPPATAWMAEPPDIAAALAWCA